FSSKLFSQEILKYSDGDLEFSLTKVCEEQDCQISKIQVLKNGVLKQSIKPGKNNFRKTFPVDQLFLTEDMNFDGRTDFRLIEFLPAGPNIPYLYWIYNPEQDLFEANSAYTEIIFPDFDNEKKEIN
ncbi:XAC2610-related protein, partial [Salinimicrobium oceani]|nr:nitrite reductase [Salinimicrobium oceani]